MEFTDEDLATTKKELKQGYMTLTTTGGMQALLARLEAAEKVCSLVYAGDDLTAGLHRPKKFCDAMSAWRKSAGRASKDSEG